MYMHDAHEVCSSDPCGYGKTTVMFYGSKLHSRASLKTRYDRTHVMVNQSFSSRSQECLKLQHYKVKTAKNRFVQQQ